MGSCFRRNDNVVEHATPGLTTTTRNDKGTRTEVRMPLLGVDYGFTGFNWVRMYFEFDQLLTMFA